MKEYDWCELVDARVDDEISPDERAALERRAQEDPEIRAQLKWAYTLRERLRASRVALPVGFSDRLQNALRAAQDGAPIAAPPRRVDDAKSVRRPVAVGASVAVAALVAAGLAFKTLRQETPNNPIVDVEPQAPSRTENSQEFEIALDPPDVPVMTPSPEGRAAENVAKRASQRELWTIVEVADSSALKKNASELQRLCAKLGLSFSKFDGGREYRIANVSQEEWRALAEKLDAIGARESSDALKAWSENASTKRRNLRVSFRLQEANTPDAAASNDD